MGSRSALLLLARDAPQTDLLHELAAAAHAAGARLLLATYSAGDGEVRSSVDGLRELLPAARGHGPRFRRALRRAKPAERFWLHVRADTWLAAKLQGVSVVVPIDTRAQLAARRLAELHPHLRVESDPALAVRWLGTNRPRRLLRNLLSPRERSRRDPESEDVQHADRTLAAVKRHLDRGDHQAAEDLTQAALATLARPRARADLLGDLVSRELAEGWPSPLARRAYAAELEVADRHLAAGRVRAAADSFEEALRTAFHPTLHFNGLTSPLAADPAGFTAPLRESAVAVAVRAGAGRRTPFADLPQGRPTRLLLATRQTQAFMSVIRERFCGLAEFETRYVDFTELPGPVRHLGASAFAQQRLGLESGLVGAAEQFFRPYLDWADVVLVDWCSDLAVLFTSLDAGDTRIVVRLHSYEVFSRWPHLVDFTRVDDLVFVSEHLEKVAVAVIPALQGAEAPRRHVVPNAMDLCRMGRPKDDDARFTLGLVGMSKIVKDPRWAIEVLRLVRATDPRYRLLLVGGDFQDPASGTHAYAEALARDLAELEPLGAVKRFGHTDDVAAALQRVGVIVSSSVRESFHMGLVEGAASGAVPVVRDWPFFPGAVAELFPAQWIVESPEAAAARVLEVTATEESWRAAGAAASEHVLERWDWAVVRGRYEDLLRGRSAVER